jgi:hypothetical protein
MTLDINDLYVNIQINESINLTKIILINNTLYSNTIHESTSIPNTLLQ